MNNKPIVFRASAQADVQNALDHYRAVLGEKGALGFVDALERAYRHIARYPAAGSPRYGHELDLPGLRSWPLRRFPYLIFFIEREEHIDVWRMLHDQRDIPAWMQDG